MSKKVLVFLLVIGGLVLVASIGPALPQQESPQEPELTVTISPEISTTYEQTVVMIDIKGADALQSGPEIEDETRGIRRLILWSHPISSWQESYTLPQLFPKEGLKLGDQIMLRVTIKTLWGEEKTVKKSILFKP